VSQQSPFSSPVLITRETSPLRPPPASAHVPHLQQKPPAANHEPPQQEKPLVQHVPWQQQQKPPAAHHDPLQSQALQHQQSLPLPPPIYTNKSELSLAVGDSSELGDLTDVISVQDVFSPQVATSSKSSWPLSPSPVLAGTRGKLAPVRKMQSHLATDYVGLPEDEAAMKLKASLCRARLSILDYSNGSELKPWELARCWAEAARTAMGVPLDFQDSCHLAAAVEQAFDQLDVDRSGSISPNEWMHRSLLESFSPGPAAIEVIDARIRELDNDDLIPFLVRTWAKVDPNGLGVALRSNADRISCEEVSDVFVCNGTEDASYAEFCAHHLGLKQSRVALCLYDLSKNMSHLLSPLLLGKYEEGLWHSSVVVFDKEYFYYGNIQASEPGQTVFKTPTKIMQLGFTLHDALEFHEYIDTIEHMFQPHLYDIFTHNCNDLSDDLVFFLMGRHIPNSVRLMTERLANAHLVRAVRPMLNRLLGQRPETPDDWEEDELQERFEQDRRDSSQSITGLNGYKDLDPDAMERSSATSKFTDSREPSKSCVISRDIPSSRRSGKVKRVALPPVPGSLVLANIPECLAPVVGRVLEAHVDSTAVIRWFDAAGCPRVTSAVRSTDLKPYHTPGTGSAGYARSVYQEALDTIRTVVCEDSQSFGDAGYASFQRQLSKLSIQPVLEGHFNQDMRSWTECPRGHPLRPVTSSCCSGPSDPGHCMLCGERMRKAEARLSCSCKYMLCEDCFQHRHVVARQSGSAFGKAMSTDSMSVRCPKKHPMERVIGQPLNKSDTCSICGLTELGASTPFYLTCRLCAYNMCHSCARHSTVERTRRMPSMMFLKQRSTNIKKAMVRRGARLSRMLQSAREEQRSEG